MIACFPVSAPEGLDSKVFGHFGSAPAFVVCDTESGALSVIDNGDMGHEHGKCNPLRALGNTRVDCVVVGGIGGGALSKLNNLGIKVFRADGGEGSTVRDNIAQLAKGTLKTMSPFMVCKSHGDSGEGCHHH